MISSRNCFTTKYFMGCVDALLLSDKKEDIKVWIDHIGKRKRTDDLEWNIRYRYRIYTTIQSSLSCVLSTLLSDIRKMIVVCFLLILQQQGATNGFYCIVMTKMWKTLSRTVCCVYMQYMRTFWSFKKWRDETSTSSSSGNSYVMELNY